MQLLLAYSNVCIIFVSVSTVNCYFELFCDYYFPWLWVIFTCTFVSLNTIYSSILKTNKVSPRDFPM